jgi:hypothetical protein
MEISAGNPGGYDPIWYLMFAIIFIYIIIPAAKRLYIRTFWTKTTAQVVRRPYSDEKKSFFFPKGVLTEIAYETPEGNKIGKCRIPSNAVDGENDEQVEQIFWHCVLRMEIPVYYSPKKPEKIEFVGNLRMIYSSVTLVKGEITDWLTVLIPLAIFLWALL